MCARQPKTRLCLSPVLRACAGCSAAAFTFYFPFHDFDTPSMPLIVSLPILCALGARIAFTIINTDPTPSTEDALVDNVVQGLFQGVLIQLVYSEHQIFAPALALACAGRLVAMAVFASSEADIHAAGIAGISAVVGFAFSYLLSTAVDEWAETSSTDADEAMERRRERRREREIARKEHMRARLREINARERGRDKERDSSPLSNLRSRSLDRTQIRRRSRSRALSASPQRTEHTTVPPTLITETSTTMTMEQLGYTGLGRLLDLELANLRKRAATAEADRRRCKEEKKWAIAQGDTSRAKQLAWQVKRYAAMAESYTREADRRIIEATRAAHPSAASFPAEKGDSPLSGDTLRQETDTDDQPYPGQLRRECVVFLKCRKLVLTSLLIARAKPR